MRVNEARFWFFPTVCLIMTCYFIFHAVQGNRGYRRMFQLKEEIVIAQKIAAETRAERVLLETKVKSLSPDSLDLDQLEESALRVLNMGNPDDQIIFE